MKNRWTWVALVAILFGLATPLAYADDDDNGNTVASLNGESFISQEIGQGSEVSESIVTGTCNLIGSSEFQFTITGEAAGPYSGTFTESGTLVTDPLGLDTSFESTFTINSPAGTVEGSKSLIASNLAICGSAIGGPNAVSFQGTVSYTATITTPNGTREDSGTASVTLQDLQVRDVENFNGHSFSETFTSNDPGGGGGDDDDDDDGGDDDDD